MSWSDAARYRLRMLRRALLDRAALRRELDEELAFHLELDAMHRRQGGDAPDAARRAARARLGSPARARAPVIDATGVSGLEALAQDLRFAARTFRRAPGFALVVVLTLALGIGATTAVFGVADAALLRPLPYAAPRQLVAVADQQDVETPLSYPELLRWRGAREVFADVAAYFATTLALSGGGEPEVLAGARVSASMARTLGVTPLVGRAFRDEEDAPSAERVILLGEGLWRRRFGADPAVVGRALTLDGRPWTVVGVLPGGARAALPEDVASGRRVDFWIPLRLDEQAAPPGLHFLSAVGRLRPGVDVPRARDRLAALVRGLGREGGRHGVIVAPLADRVVGDARHVLVLLLGAVGAVLLVCCTNVASLLLARGAARVREVAVRSALGAGRRRVARQLVTESLALALAGGALGVGVAYAGLAALRASAAATLPRVAETGVDGRVLAFALAVSLATGLLFGLAPALRLSRAFGPAEVLRGAGRGAVGGGARDRLRPALVVAEVALSFVLLVGAGLLLRSFDRLLAVDKGFASERVLTFTVSLPGARYAAAPQQMAFFARALETVRAVPGVRSAALVSHLPLAGGTNGTVGIAGRTYPQGAAPIAEKRIAGADYFAVLGIPVVAGRAFTAADGPGAPKVAVVNEAFARRHFPGENPIGRGVDFGWETTGTQEIVGVVRDIRETGLDAPAQPTVYVPFGQRSNGESFAFFVVRTRGEPLRLLGALRAAVYAVDRDQPIDQVRTLDAVVAERLAGRRLALSVLGGFSALALLLAAVGLYAVVSHAVSQRVQEIGVRMALGARSGTVLRLVLLRSGALVGAGVVVGAAGALGAARLLAGMLYDVAPTDPATFAGVAAVLGGVALAASAVPALRASRVDPVRALREG